MSARRAVPALDGARWDRISRVFEEAIDIPPDERDAWLVSESGDDAVMLDLLRRMLAADEHDEGLLARGIGGVAHLGLEADASLAPGTRIGAFDVIGELGRGGMGIIYEARDRHLGRAAALKFLPSRAGEHDSADRVIAEAKAASALDHPNVATVYQVGETDDGRRYIAMPRYDGETLSARLARGPISPAEAGAIARQVGAGLAAAHRAGIVHRDVTTANIFLTRDGPVKLLDFGIAGLASAPTDPAVVRGTVSFMSPEQARGEQTDARTDVWALGVVMFRMLTGEMPFAGATSWETLERIRGPQAAPRVRHRRGIPRAIARVVGVSLEKDASRRYADAGAMVRALEEASASRFGWWVRVGSLAFVAAITGVVVLRDRQAPDARGVAVSPVPDGTATLAVLPARVDAVDARDAYLGDGVVNELTARLARLRRLWVKSPRAAALTTGTQTPAEVGTALGVEYLLETGIRRRDSLVVISLGLIDAVRGFQIWTADYVAGAADMLVMQDSIARDVAAALTGELSDRERATLGARVTSSPIAYDHFLRANYLLGKRSPAALREAVREYGVAVEHDGRFAEALARWAYAYLLFADWGWDYPDHSPAELVASAGALTERASAIDPQSAQVWLSRAYLRVVRDPYRFDGALPLFERALRLDSLDAEAHHQYGQTLMSLGRYDEANAAYLRALALDPARPMTLVPLAAIALQQHRWTAARRWADSAVAVTRVVPAPYALAVRAHVRLRTGDVAGALGDARRSLELDSSYAAPARSVMAVALARSGDSAGARAALERMLATIDPTHPSATDARFVGSALFALGRVDDALALIERARPRAAMLWFYLRSSDFDPYRTLPRFRRVFEDADPTVR